MREDDLPYRVDVWDDKDSHIEEIIALTSHYATAKSAYEAAVKHRPGRFITLRQGQSNSEHTNELTALCLRTVSFCSICWFPQHLV